MTIRNERNIEQTATQGLTRGLTTVRRKISGLDKAKQPRPFSFGQFSENFDSSSIQLQVIFH